MCYFFHRWSKYTTVENNYGNCYLIKVCKKCNAIVTNDGITVRPKDINLKKEQIDKVIVLALMEDSKLAKQLFE